VTAHSFVYLASEDKMPKMADASRGVISRRKTITRIRGMSRHLSTCAITLDKRYGVGVLETLEWQAKLYFIYTVSLLEEMGHGEARRRNIVFCNESIGSPQMVAFLKSVQNSGLSEAGFVSVTLRLSRMRSKDAPVRLAIPGRSMDAWLIVAILSHQQHDPTLRIQLAPAVIPKIYTIDWVTAQN
jgi:hypothetical protein